MQNVGGIESFMLPWSKSIVNRLLVIKYLEGQLPQELSDTDLMPNDCKVLHRLLTDLRKGNTDHYNCGDCGTAARFLAALLATTPGTYTLDGSPRMRQRPMLGLISAIRQGGATITCLHSPLHLPFVITGTGNFADELELDISESSQYASALLLVAPHIHNGLRLRLKNTADAPSLPYIDMTLTIMKLCGIECSQTADAITIPNAHYAKTLPLTYEPDWSAAAFCYQKIATSPRGSSMLLKELRLQSIQGDNATADIFKQLGVSSTQTDEGVVITNTGKVCGRFEHNFRKTPDLVPAVACTAAALGLEASITGIAGLRAKESDRVAALAHNLTALGYNINHDSDHIHINECKMQNSECRLDGFGDHRIIMAFALMTRNNPTVMMPLTDDVAKSFPNFQTL